MCFRRSHIYALQQRSGRMNTLATAYRFRALCGFLKAGCQLVLLISCCLNFSPLLRCFALLPDRLYKRRPVLRYFFSCFPPVADKVL